VQPRLVSCSFGNGEWLRLSRVLAYSAAQHCADWDRRIARIDPPAPQPGVHDDAHLANTQKLEHWAAAVRTAGDGQRLLLIDADTAILRSLDDIWDREFDVAYTTRPVDCLFPFNAGVIFLRVGPRVRELMEAWRAANQLMLIDRAYHLAWRPRFGGINQAALGAVLADPAHVAGVTLLPLPCAEWNCEDTGWSDFAADRTRILHIKTQLRRVVFRRSPPDRLAPLMNLWQQLERAALAVSA
jgi:hypothetical protein